MGLATVADVRRLPLVELRRHLGARAGTELHLQAQGLADYRAYPANERKSISKETTFAEDITDPAVLRDTPLWAAQEVGYLARHEGRKGSVVTLKIRFHGFETHTRSRTLPVPRRTTPPSTGPPGPSRQRHGPASGHRPTRLDRPWRRTSACSRIRSPPPTCRSRTLGTVASRRRSTPSAGSSAAVSDWGLSRRK